VALPRSTQRLLALLALSERQLPRAVVAGRLWPDTSEHLSQSSLRSALWRLHRTGHVLVNASAGQLRLADAVAVDIAEIVSIARMLIEDRLPADLDVDPSVLSSDLLPGWHDDWVVAERERLRQLCLHGLEALAGQLLRRGQHARAIEVALAAIGREPLRESAHRVLIQVHLEECNRSEAIREYLRFAELIRDELGIRPSPGLGELIGLTHAAPRFDAGPRANDATPSVRWPGVGPLGG
jgi:DNA-binding SARP family transcriptional activator